MTLTCVHHFKSIKTNLRGLCLATNIISGDCPAITFKLVEQAVAVTYEFYNGFVHYPYL